MALQENPDSVQPDIRGKVSFRKTAGYRHRTPP
jgi:hypothetical protein